MTARTAPLHLVMPQSVSSWFHHFVRQPERDRVVALGEAPTVDIGGLLAAVGRARATTVILHSSHDTMVRDRDVAGTLTRHGYQAVAQSARSVALGIDKFRMKTFFDAHGFPSLPWIRGDALPELSGNQLVVIKARTGTQSRGTLLGRLRERPPGPDEFAEHYADGVEYSVVVFRDRGRLITFPPVWKGQTSTALVPPWRRLRLCPYESLDPRLDRRMRELARQLAVAADCVGLMEVEYLVTADGSVQILEINPRVSGTMRLAAMATGVPIFSLHGDRGVQGDLPATGHAAEIPYRGEPFSDPERGVFATSRLTVVADDPDEAMHKLRSACGAWVTEPALAAAP